MPTTVSDMVLEEFAVILTGSRNHDSLHTRKHSILQCLWVHSVPDTMLVKDGRWISQMNSRN